MKAGGSPRKRPSAIGAKKGPAFEREICKSLSLWISGGERDDIFWRTAMSGGRATIGLRAGKKRDAQAGDISAIHSLGERLLNHVVVDTKWYGDIQFLGAVFNDRGRVYSWWHELLVHADSFGKKPMLIVRQNGYPVFVMLTPWSFERLFGLTYDHASMVIPRMDCYVVLYDRFVSDAVVPKLTMPAEVKRRVRLV